MPRIIAKVRSRRRRTTQCGRSLGRLARVRSGHTQGRRKKNLRAARRNGTNTKPQCAKRILPRNSLAERKLTTAGQTAASSPETRKVAAFLRSATPPLLCTTLPRTTPLRLPRAPPLACAARLPPLALLAALPSPARRLARQRRCLLRRPSLRLARKPPRLLPRLLLRPPLLLALALLLALLHSVAAVAGASRRPPHGLSAGHLHLAAEERQQQRDAPAAGRGFGAVLWTAGVGARRGTARQGS